MINSNPLLAPDRAERLRRALVVLAAMAGLAAAAVVLSSQTVTDFLREGPVRVVDLEGERLRVLLGLGTALATMAALACFWVRPGLRIAVLGTVALGGGLFLIHGLLLPAVGLFAAAVATDYATHISRAQLRSASPRRYPIAWFGFGSVGVAAVVGLVWATVWLATPLFDSGTELNEALGFQVPGLEQPEDVQRAAIAAVTDALATPSEQASTAAPSQSSAATIEASAPSATEAPASENAAPASAGEGQGMLIASGNLQGADAFHTGSGEVLLVQGPDGGVILRFQDYEVRNGPDLRIYLSPDPGGDVRADGAISLGPIKATSGFVNYDVPSGVDPSIFRSVIIYCEPFGVVFATAVIG